MKIENYHYFTYYTLSIYYYIYDVLGCEYWNNFFFAVFIYMEKRITLVLFFSFLFGRKKKKRTNHTTFKKPRIKNCGPEKGRCKDFEYDSSSARGPYVYATSN